MLEFVQRLADVHIGTREGELVPSNLELRVSHNMINIYSNV